MMLRNNRKASIENMKEDYNRNRKLKICDKKYAIDF